MAGQFKPGDVVRLKSGGPDMTVEKVDGDRVSVVWVGDAGHQVRDAFLAWLVEALSFHF